MKLTPKISKLGFKFDQMQSSKLGFLEEVKERGKNSREEQSINEFGEMFRREKKGKKEERELKLEYEQ